MDIVIDPKFERLLPPLDEEEFSKLEQDVRENGIMDPLKVWKGKGVLVDGHHRYKLAQKYGLEYEVDEIGFTSAEDVAWWMINNQAGRRNLTKTQQALMYADAENLVESLKAMAKDAQSDLHKRGPVHVNKILAEKAGVSHGMMDMVMAVKKSGNQELLEKMRSGIMSAHEAYQRVKAVERKMKEDVPAADDPSILVTGNRIRKNGWKTNEVRRLMPMPSSLERESCFICGKHEGITVAHHVVPVSELTTYLNVGWIGVSEVSSPIVWLCPNCHAYVHAALDGNFDVVAPMMADDEWNSRFEVIWNKRHTYAADELKIFGDDVSSADVLSDSSWIDKDDIEEMV